MTTGQQVTTWAAKSDTYQTPRSITSSKSRTRSSSLARYSIRGPFFSAKSPYSPFTGASFSSPLYACQSSSSWSAVEFGSP
ncbi:unnamed protein product [Fusarium graminearum]|nr:unnamed protein product [Fusarium graminearum]